MSATFPSRSRSLPLIPADFGFQFAPVTPLSFSMTDGVHTLTQFNSTVNSTFSLDALANHRHGNSKRAVNRSRNRVEFDDSGKQLRILCGDVVTPTPSTFDTQLKICREEYRRRHPK